MADFCNKCAPEMWGKDAPVDIDVYSIADGLERGHFESVLCEGCGIRAVGKDTDGCIMVAILEEEGHVEDMVRWYQVADWENLPAKI